VASNADYVLIPERNPADLKGMMAKLREVKKRRNYGLVVVAEGADHPDLEEWASEIAGGLTARGWAKPRWKLIRSGTRF
jgi:6-phosphofructokinase